MKEKTSPNPPPNDFGGIDDKGSTSPPEEVLQENKPMHIDDLCFEVRFGEMEGMVANGILLRLSHTIINKHVIQKLRRKIAQTRAFQNKYISSPKALSQLRVEKGMTKKDMQISSGIGVPNLTKIENENATPYISTLQRYLKSIGASLKVSAQFDFDIEVPLTGAWMADDQTPDNAAITPIQTNQKASPKEEIEQPLQELLKVLLSLSAKEKAQILNEATELVRDQLIIENLEETLNVLQENAPLPEPMRLGPLAISLGLSQDDLMKKGLIGKSSIIRFQIDKRTDLKINTLAGYLNSAGANLRLQAQFADGTCVPITGLTNDMLLESYPFPGMSMNRKSRKESRVSDQNALLKILSALTDNNALNQIIELLTQSSFPKKELSDLRNVQKKGRGRCKKTLPEMRQLTGLTQTEVGKKSNVRQTSISDLEKSFLEPTLYSVDRYISGLGGTLHALARFPDQGDFIITNLLESFCDVAAKSPIKDEQPRKVPLLYTGDVERNIRILPANDQNAILSLLTIMISEKNDLAHLTILRATNKKYSLDDESKTLEELRGLFNCAAEDLAEKSGLSKNGILALEDGTIKTPKVVTLERYIQGLGGKLSLVVLLPGLLPMQIKDLTLQNIKKEAQAKRDARREEVRLKQDLVYPKLTG